MTGNTVGQNEFELSWILLYYLLAYGTTPALFVIDLRLAAGVDGTSCRNVLDCWKLIHS